MIRLARRLLAVLLPADVRETMLAELDEEYARAIRPSRGAGAAARWYWMQVAGSLLPALAMRRRRVSFSWRWIADAIQDARFGARVLKRQKLFTAAVVATLTLGIGSTTTILSLVDVVLVRPLPYHDPDRLVRIWSANPRGIARAGIAPPDYFDWRERGRGFDAIAAYASADTTLTGGGDPIQVTGVNATANLVETLGVSPRLGRWFTPSDPEDSVVVIAEPLWRERFGADTGVIGKSLVLDGRPRTIIGVMPQGFRFPSRDARLWLPLPETWRAQPRNAHFMGAVGRIANGVSLETARDSLRDVARALEQTYPDTNRGWGVTVTSMRDWLIGDVRMPLLVLLAAVVCVLLIACANVASLMLARGVVRSRELAVRAAVGASRGRLLRQQAVESLLLAGLGGGLGLAAASWALRALHVVPGIDLPLPDGLALDGRSIAATIGVSLIAAVLAGILPAWRATRHAGERALAAGTRSTGGHVRLRQAIVFAQVAAATVLVAAGVLLLKSFDRLTAVPSGFAGDQTLLADVTLPSTRYARVTRAPFFDRALERIRTLPGVQSAGAGGPLPLSGSDGLMRFGVRIEGDTPPPDRSDRAYLRWATSGYFSAMGIAQRSGRPFHESDIADATPVAVIDDAFVRRFFGAGDPIGRRIQLSNERSTWRLVVGVVGSVRQTALDRSADPHVYVPQSQYPSPALTLVVRGTYGAPPAGAAIRDVIRSIDPDLPIGNVRTLADLVAGSTASRRANTIVLSLFAATALALTLVGVYGVVSQSVAHSTREIGVRVALGASGTQVVSLIVGRGLKVAGAGVVAGSIAAWLALPALAGLLYEVAPRDPAVLVLTATVLLCATACAAYLPTRRLNRVDVVNALRPD